MKFHWKSYSPPEGAQIKEWSDWRWQIKASLSRESDFASYFELTNDERAAFEQGTDLFRIRTTPYYANLARGYSEHDPIRKILIPTSSELTPGAQQMLDPLGENKNRPARRIIHRYSDRVLFLVTDFCSVYCRYCTRKHFTATDQVFPKASEYDESLSYIKKQQGIREVILTGGDPLTLSNKQLERVLDDLRSIEHIEIIRLGTRMPVVCPMRIDDELVKMMKKHHPIFVMTHFNHPREVTGEAAESLLKLVDNGFPVLNQMVLLNGVNNHPAVVQALSRRLLYLRVKPYYMFQCDPSEGTDHLRTSIDESLQIQRELWGHLSGLAMPNYSVDIPEGGGKAYFVPNFQTGQNGNTRSFVGWDGVEADYVSPEPKDWRVPIDAENYFKEWEQLKKAKERSQDERI